MAPTSRSHQTQSGRNVNTVPNTTNQPNVTNVKNSAVKPGLSVSPGLLILEVGLLAVLGIEGAKADVEVRSTLILIPGRLDMNKIQTVSI